MRVVTVAGDPEREATVAARLGDRKDVEVVLRCVDRVEALASLRGASLDAMVLVGDPVWFDAECIHEATVASTTLVALVPDPARADRLQASGAVILSYDATIDRVVDSCRRSPASPTPPIPPTETGSGGKLIAVWGPKGAPGRSSIAIELAAELARTEPSTLLIDADTYGGDLLQLTGVVDELTTIVWAARLAAKRELDGETLTRELRRAWGQGPVLLPGIPRADLWPEVSDFGWKELLEQSRRSFAFVVCDVGFSLETDASSYVEQGDGRNRVARATLRVADHVLAVCRADPVGIKNFVWTYEHLRDLVDEDRILIVANRVRRDEQRQVSDLLKRYTRKRPIASIPDDGTRFGEVAGDRAATGPVPAAVAELAAAIGATVRPRGFLARLGGRS